MVADDALRQRKPDAALTNGHLASSSAAPAVMPPRVSKPGVDRRGSPESPAARRPSSLGGMATLAVFYAVVTWYAQHRLYWTPRPLGAFAPETKFSETRAMAHTFHLASTIGDRQLTEPGNAAAAAYLYGHAQQLAELANRRTDMSAQADIEFPTGALNMVFLRHMMTNAYANVSNVVLVLQPVGVADRPALLMNAHFDSTLGSAGASDCASCVGVLLELARVLVADPTIKLSAPVVFLFNGAEETFLQSSHGFTSSSKWAERIGAFINLESTGSAGPDVVFQHAGDWTIKDYAASAKYPRGSVVGQDFFKLGLIPADTDFSIYADPEHAGWPGLDIAFLLDAASYHTDRDTVERIKAGTLQASGDNLLMVVPTFCDRLANDPNATAPIARSDSPSVYFDILAFHMLTYPYAAACISQLVPLAVLVMLLWGSVQTVVEPKGRAGGAATQLPDSFNRVLSAAGLTLLSIVAAMLVPASLGALRVAVLGNPMIWYGKQLVARAIYLPTSVASLVAPYALLKAPGELVYSLLGFALTHTLLGILVTNVGGLGSGAIFLMWSVAALLSAGTIPRVPRRWQLRVCLFWATVPALTIIAGAICYNTHIIDKLSMSGSVPGYFGHLIADAAVGTLLGLGAVCAVGYGGLLIAHTLGPRSTVLKFAVALLQLSVAVALAMTIVLRPYTVDAPKKILLQHLHIQNASSSAIDRSAWIITAFDSAPIADALPDMPLVPTASLPHDTMMFYPVSELLNPVAFEAPPSVPDDGVLPYIVLISTTEVPAPTNGGTEGRHLRLELELRLPAPGWGFANITGPLQAWSFTDKLPIAKDPHGSGMHFPLRFAGGMGTETWPFWLDLPANASPGALRLELSCSTSWKSAALAHFRARMPPWTAVAATTTFQSIWQYP